MSVQAVSRIAALLALDADLLKDYVPKYADDDYDQDTDLNEANRAQLAHLYRNQLTQEESDLIAGGDANATSQYIAAHLDRPVNGGAAGGGG